MKIGWWKKTGTYNLASVFKQISFVYDGKLYADGEAGLWKTSDSGSSWDFVGGIGYIPSFYTIDWVSGYAYVATTFPNGRQAGCGWVELTGSESANGNYCGNTSTWDVVAQSIFHCNFDDESVENFWGVCREFRDDDHYYVGFYKKEALYDGVWGSGADGIYYPNVVVDFGTGNAIEVSNFAVSGDCAFCLIDNKVDNRLECWKFNSTNENFLKTADGGNYDLYESSTEKCEAFYDDDDAIRFLVEDGGVIKEYTYIISTSGLSLGSATSIFYMKRDFYTGYEKEYAFDKDDDIIYRVPVTRTDDLTPIYHLSFSPYYIESVAIVDDVETLLTNSGAVYSVIDCASDVVGCEIKHRVRNYPTAEMVVKETLSIGYNNKIEVEDLYTSSGTTQSGVIFEGIVEDKDLKDVKWLRLESPANEIDVIRPIVSYTGATPGEVVTGLIQTYCKYVVTGVIDTGGLTGTYGFKGEKTLRTIFDWAADQRLMHWYLDGTGALYMNGGDVHSQVTGIATDKIWDVDGHEISRKVNKVLLYGGISGGVQITGLAENSVDQAAFGEILYKDTYSHVKEPVVLSGCAVEVLARKRLLPLDIEFSYRETKTGFVQPGENFRMETGIKIVGSRSTLTTGDYIINENYYDAKRGISYFRASDGLLFEPKKEDRLAKQVQENSDLLQQILELV